MQEPDNSTCLFDDRLALSTKEYVCGLVPETETEKSTGVYTSKLSDRKST